jgi:alkylation response protein AidB-like acyl-CoA dehydrogenase
MKIPKEYGGLGLSQTNYSRAIMLIGSFCGSTTVWLSAHQSIGAPQPLMLFGTEEQKRLFLPRMAKGTISAFALTEPGVGSDPATMQTTATPIEDGNAYLLNGEKLWCTNGPVAEVLIVMARTPSIKVHGRERKQITAFLIERSMPGFEVGHRCDFMGLKGIQNGVVRFKNLRVPKENIVWGLGQGLKLALTTLNAGRIAIPAACVGTTKRCLQISRQWANQREQWGSAIGKHETIAAKIADMAATTFAMEAMVELTSELAGRKKNDIRLEAALSKMFCSEACWRIADDMVQIRGGRGYETALSLRGRGEAPIPAERILRDSRINRIIEGTSEIMRLFIAREALDAHLRPLNRLMDPKASLATKTLLFLKTAVHYACWYCLLWIPPRWIGSHMGFAAHSSQRLARCLFHSALRFQAGLARRQQRLGRLVDIGAELFAMVAACAKAESLTGKANSAHAAQLADLYCRQARRRVQQLFRSLSDNDDKAGYQLAQRVLDGELIWLERGIL